MFLFRALAAQLAEEVLLYRFCVCVCFFFLPEQFPVGGWESLLALVWFGVQSKVLRERKWVSFKKKKKERVWRCFLKLLVRVDNLEQPQPPPVEKKKKKTAP